MTQHTKINAQLFLGNNLDLLKQLPDNSVDAIVTDPPYGLGKEPDAAEVLQSWVTTGYHEVEGKGFMGKEWDAFVPQPLFWKEAYRVLKHGGHVLSFFGTRTYDWGVMAMRLAGFEVRDSIQYLYGSGFPKSHNISKAIDKKPNLHFIKEWKKWLGVMISNSQNTQKDINDFCGFNAVGYARYDSNDYWATNRPTNEKWEKMKKAIGITTSEWDFICDSNEEERGFVEPTGGLAGGTGNTVGKFTGKQLSNNSISDAAKEWDGWGSALKPAHEPIVLARKPLEKGLSIAENVIKHSTGGLNIDGCRVNFKDEADYEESTTKNQHADFGSKPVTDNVVYGDYSMVKPKNYAPTGRYPANLILAHHPDCECVGTKKVKGQIDKPTNRVQKGNTWNETNSGMRKNLPQNSGGFADENGEETVEDWICVEDCPVRMLDEQSGDSVSKIGNPRGTYKKGMFANSEFNKVGREYDDFGGASRFFYTAKASKDDRNEGLKGFAIRQTTGGGGMYNEEAGSKYGSIKAPNKNFHPTVKPTDLMRYLCRLITPPNGIVLDPFMGSGSTGKAAILEGFQFIGMELDEDYFKIAEARIDKAKRDYFDSIAQLNLF